MSKPTFRELIVRYGRAEFNHGEKPGMERLELADQAKDALLTALRRAGIPLDGSVDD